MHDLAKNIRNALSDKKSRLLDDARQILNALEYDSERTLDETHSAREFLREYDPKNGEGINAKELQQCAEKIGIIFQMGDEEINRGLMTPAFKPDDEKSFIFVAADLDPKQHYPRWRLARITRAVNRCFAAPAVVIFRHPDADKQDSISLSFIYRRPSRTDSAKDVLGRVSILRGIRRDNPHRGHLDILKDLALSERVEWMRDKKQSPGFDGLLAAWLFALDTEELNKRFYKKLLAWFERAVQQCKFPDDKIPGKSEEQVMRMITRLLFIWFVKEKGLASENLFTDQFAGDILKNHQPENSNYYRAVLQNIFFGVLNTPQKERGFRPHNKPPPGKKYNDPQHRVFTFYRYADLMKSPPDFVSAVGEIPFVNGGLFDCLDDFERGGSAKNRNRAAGRIDCFTDNRHDRKMLDVPSCLFFAKDDGLFTLFNQFKFTVDENTPLDQEVALDPELLGLVFENLLAAITPESRKNARKQTGSYYTPRPIVEYMVDEALIAHLAGILGKKSAPKLRKLLEWEDITDDLFSAGEKKTITNAIDKLRILDPAVGSGAFPMGMLHKLVHILWQVDKENKKWKEKQLEKAAEISDPSIRGRMENDIERVFSEENNYDDYGRKLFLIQNAIHGVDLQPVAAQIARLRFFISLIIDQKPHDDQPNRGIEPLPNLETKFVAADSLIGLARKGQANLSETEEVQKLKDKINRVRIAHFGANTRKEKIRLRVKDKELRDELAKALTKLGFVQSDASRFAAWDLYDQTAGADWFDAELMMGVRDGFDIVIGNPPYVRHELFKEKKPALKAHFGEFFASTADLYTYFYHKGMSELRKGGHLCFITSNGFMRGGYGNNTRKFLGADFLTRSVVEFSGVAVFEAAVDPVIVHTQKLPVSTNSKFIGSFAEENEDVFGIADFVHRHGQLLPIMECLSGPEWIIRDGENAWKLLAKMRRIGRPLCEYTPAQIRMGIKTGCNEAFVINKDVCDQLIAENAKSAEIIKPWLCGRNICKWRTEDAKFYIITTVSSANYQWPWSGKKDKKEAEKIFAKQFPAIHRRLSGYREQLEKRTDKAVFWWELRTCDYYEEFDSPKIFYPDIANPMRGSYDKTGALCANTGYILAVDDLSLLGFFNSRAFDWYAHYALQTLGNPWRKGGLRFFTQSMEQVPVPPMDKKDKAEISRRVKAILRSPSDPDVAGLESEIDEIVYRLYGLTAAEIRLVESGGS